MSAEVVAIYDTETADELERLWHAFLSSKKAAFDAPTIDSAISAGKAFGALLQALAHADDQSLAAVQHRVQQ